MDVHPTRLHFPKAAPVLRFLCVADDAKTKGNSTKRVTSERIFILFLYELLVSIHHAGDGTIVLREGHFRVLCWSTDIRGF